MFRKPFVVLLVVALLAALLLRLPALILLCSLVLLAVGIAGVWRRWALRRVEYVRALSDDRVFPGDEVTLTVRIVNRKPLPLTRLDVFDVMPPELSIVGTRYAVYGSAGKQASQRSLSLGWYEAVTKRYQMRASKRGVYFLGPAYMRTGDPFGFFTGECSDDRQTRLVVYPALLPTDQFPFALRQFLGDLRRHQQVFVDPSRTVGVRDYQRDDPRKSIHWQATARRGELQTRVYEPTTTVQAMCFLDVDTYEHVREGILPQQAERLISTAATVATLLLRAKQSAGLVTNGVTANQASLVRIDPSRSPTQLARMLETLAAVKPYSHVPMARVLHTVPQTLAAGTTIVLISAVASATTQQALVRLRRHYAVCWIFLGEYAPALPGVAVFHMPPRHEAHFQPEVPQ
jgi:uncharacterized protein (DUF58 family)